MRAALARRCLGAALGYPLKAALVERELVKRAPGAKQRVVKRVPQVLQLRRQPSGKRARAERHAAAQLAPGRAK